MGYSSRSRHRPERESPTYVPSISDARAAAYDDRTIHATVRTFTRSAPVTTTTMVQMCRHPPARRLAAAMMEEALEVARQLGSEPDISIERRLAGAERVGEHETSMLQDLHAGKPLELGPILTAVIELAELTGACVPSLRAIHAATDLLGRRAATRSAAV